MDLRGYTLGGLLLSLQRGRYRMSHNFITTYTGKQINPLDPDPAMIDIVDIAHHLACLNRFCGALERPYSVAEHSVRVSCLLSGRNALAGLLHDASEAYLSDLSTPIKHSSGMGAYRDAEARLQAAIYERFGVGDFDREAVRRADEDMLHTEALCLFATAPAWADRSRRVVGRIIYREWYLAKEWFLASFRALQASVKQLAEKN